MTRKILAVVFALLAGSAFNMAFIAVSNTVYPLPDHVDPNDAEALKAYVEEHGMPTGALLIVLFAHAGGSLVSGLVVTLVAREPWLVAAAVLGGIWTCGGIMMLILIPAPAWFAVADVVLYIPAALGGARLAAGFLPQAADGSNPITT